MVYKQLPIDDVDVDMLRLDLQNYRIPIAPDDEDAALNYLFASEDVLEQTKLFLRDGYFDNEVPIAVKEDGAYVILEGNRRVSALKAIAKPEIAPAHQAQVEELRTRYATEVPNMPRKIRVLVVPNRAAARKHIARLHTGLSKRRWSRDRQANYYFSFLGPGATVKDLKALYPDVDIVRFLRMVAARRFLSGVKFKDKALREYVVSADLTMSSFEYAYRNAAIAAAIGLKFDSDGRIEPARKKPKNIGASLPADVRDGLEYLMTGFRSGAFNTRSSEFRAGSREQTELIARLIGSPTASDETEDPSDSSAGGGDGRGTTGGAGSSTRGTANGSGGASRGAGGAGDGGRGPNDPDTLRGLDVAGLPFEHIPSNLKKRVLELRAIHVNKTPAATAMLLRSVLEATIKWHFDGSAPPVSGMLSDVFPTAVSTYGQQRALRDSINAIKSGAATRAGSINDAVVGVSLGVVPGRRPQPVEDAREGGCTVGDDLRRDDTGGHPGALEEPAGRLGVPACRRVHVDDLPVLVDRPVQVDPPARDLDVGLVHVPAVADPVPAEPGRVGQQRAESLHPSVHGDVVDVDAALSEQLLDVAIGQPEP
jgi:uncharacterized membrane protein YgcG